MDANDLQEAYTLLKRYQYLLEAYIQFNNSKGHRLMLRLEAKHGREDEARSNYDLPLSKEKISEVLDRELQILKAQLLAYGVTV